MSQKISSLSRTTKNSYHRIHVLSLSSRSKRKTSLCGWIRSMAHQSSSRAISSMWRCWLVLLSTMRQLLASFISLTLSVRRVASWEGIFGEFGDSALAVVRPRNLKKANLLWRQRDHTRMSRCRRLWMRSVRLRCWESADVALKCCNCWKDQRTVMCSRLMDARSGSE